MTGLKIGTILTLTDGGKIKVIKEISASGGQGFVYLIEHNKQHLALKWYKQMQPDSFYKNLQSNITKGSPSNTFLWPMMLTEKQYDSFGYVMNLKPDGYYGFEDFLLDKISFKSLDSTYKAAINICQGFRNLHIQGYAYLDLNPGNFFINPLDGDVLICDNDNVVPDGNVPGIKGKMRFMAPEVVLGCNPNIYSDRFSLSLILFYLFFCDHPFEGKKYLSSPALTEKAELKHFGSEILFIYDKDDNGNLPVKQVHKNVVKFWGLFPNMLKKEFIHEFGQHRLKNPTERKTESMWGDVFATVRNQTVLCPSCSQETFFERDTQTICIHCGNRFPINNFIRTNNYGNIPVTLNRYIYLGKKTKPTGQILINKQNLCILQNQTNETWLVETLSGKIIEVESQKAMPIKKGLRITFNQTDKAEII